LHRVFLTRLAKHRFPTKWNRSLASLWTSLEVIRTQLSRLAWRFELPGAQAIAEWSECGASLDDALDQVEQFAVPASQRFHGHKALYFVHRRDFQSRGGYKPGSRAGSGGPPATSRYAAGYNRRVLGLIAKLSIAAGLSLRERR
jgi:hypothetical protein